MLPPPLIPPECSLTSGQLTLHPPNAWHKLPTKSTLAPQYRVAPLTVRISRRFTLPWYGVLARRCCVPGRDDPETAVQQGFDIEEMFLEF